MVVIRVRDYGLFWGHGSEDSRLLEMALSASFEMKIHAHGDIRGHEVDVKALLILSECRAQECKLP